MADHYPLVRVALLTPPFASYTYRMPPRFAGGGLPAGLRVAVPVGGSLRAGVVLGPEEALPEGVEARDVLWPLELSALLSPGYVAMAETLAARQMEPAGRVLATLLPAGLRTARAFLRFRHDGRMRKLALGKLSESPVPLDELAVAWRGGEARLDVAPAEPDPAYRLLVDPPWPVRPAASMQLAVLEMLFTRHQATAAQLREALGTGVSQALKTLEGKGHIVLGPPPEEPEELACQTEPDARAPLTEDQRAAFEALSPLLPPGPGGERVVHGVTGSGKTRLYFELAAQTLAAGRDVLLLAPEVALAAALRDRACAFFGHEPLFSHGYQTPARRERVFREAAQARGPHLVVGTRSALFLPLRGLGLVILDEEHDQSFKQDERMAYQAKEVAFFRARQEGALLLLGSATPDVKTFHAAREGATPLVAMTRRAGGGRLPSVELVDLNPSDRAVQLASRLDGERGVGLLAEQSAALLRETLDAGDQAMILLNRRGYAPLVFCLDCHQAARCPGCEVSLTYHKGRSRLVCHYCGQSFGFPRPCASCGGCNFLPMGEGTELLEEQLAAVLPPEIPVARLDRDVARRAGRAEAILADFARGRSRVLVGTQMLTKGHDFPDVTLVVAADGDMGLNLPDYRARERAFQMLVQVAGRAGRGEKPGRVLIQTRIPNDPFWELVKNADYEGFFAQEIEKRLKYGYPPFVKLGLARLSVPRSFEEPQALLAELGRALRQAPGVRVLGPAPAPIAMVRERRRFNCLLKAPDWPSIRGAFALARAALRGVDDARLSLDLDPVDMM
ncbi:Primosomal protein N' [Fundidesulfovibrio magnetotacticus]|uniref:Replication restart protein PriA n=1 Tax=Fundidesulfovibrio magnetotacticus TaxID=2730080 RepID=A0A6V8LYM4_9BACT|nr:primosomal protein N' [Fundidesulfovibrio magnetotacticus]GFK95119.1 Primosomal protein N' [Fundidesulfovibrio magnetotacticus]